MKRKNGFSKKLLPPLLGILAGVVVGALIVMLKGADPFSAYAALFTGAFGNLGNVTNSLIKTVPLGLTGLAVMISYRAGIFNIGCEGQLQIGAILATIVGINFAGLNTGLHIGLCVLASMAAGAFLALIPALAKAYRGYNEIVVTMLLNYIAIYFSSYMVQGPLKAPGQLLPQSIRLYAPLPFVVPGTRLHLGIVFFILLSLLLYFILNKSAFGFKIRATGLNATASDYAGIKSKRIMIGAMLISGALAGMAGACEIMGVHERLVENFSPGFGYDAIAVALLANLHPLGVMLSALFFGALRNGASNMQIVTGLPVAFVQIIQGISVLSVIASGSLPAFIQRVRGRTV
ncbi:MAG: ABC transporter permease [Bacillota bacterium]